MIRTMAAIAAAGLLATAAGLAPVRAEEPLVVTARDCVSMALASSAQLRMESARADAARARVSTMERQYLPSLVGSLSYTRLSPVDPGSITIPGKGSIDLSAPLENSYSIRLGVQQPLFTGSRLKGGVDQARAMYDAARQDERKRRRDAATAAERAFWSLVLAQETEAAIDENLATMREHKADAERRLAQGAGTKSELLGASMRLSDVEALASESRNGLAQARARLNLVIGRSWDAPTRTEPLLQAVASLEPGTSSVLSPEGIRAAVAKALAVRPDLAAVRSRIAAAEASLAVTRSSLFPSAYLTGSFALSNPNPRAFPQREGFESLWDLGLLVSIDLGRVPAVLSQGEEARAAVDHARVALEQAREGATLEIVTAALELGKTADRIAAGASSVSLAQENLRVQRDRFSSGIALPSEVSDAELALLQARLGLSRARIAYELAAVALRDALGDSISGD